MKNQTANSPSKSQPVHHRPNLGYELFFYIAVGVFGFSVMWTFLGSRNAGETIREAVPKFIQPVFPDSKPVVIETGLYEAQSHREIPTLSLSPIFMPSIQYWKDDIIKWAASSGVDPNLAATVMQIESCGWPMAGSHAGAMGLFQVMPFHFTAGEQPFDPDTNARRGLAYLELGLEKSNGHAGLALAGYNGGHSVISRSYLNWSNETQRYYRWGSGIYREASAGWETSPTLNQWLESGGRGLCQQAEAALGITP